MVAALTHRARTLELVRAALAALDDFKAKSPGEAAEVYALLAAHMRSAAPMAFATLPAVAAPTVATPTLPATALRGELNDGASYELGVVADAVTLALRDHDGDGALVTMTGVQAGTFHSDFARLIAKLAEAAR